MLVYRITHKKFSKTIIPSGLEGRWNSEGRKVLYTSGSMALALLENMVRRKGVGFNADFRILLIEIPDSLSIQTIKSEKLPAGWRSFTDYSVCQKLGNDWFDKAVRPLLKVPSAVLPEEFNYVINTTHPDFSKIKLLDTVGFIPDARIEEILKNYSRH